MSPRLARALAALLGLCVLACGPAGAQTVDARRYNAPAAFRVTNEVVNRDLVPFAATIPAVGNSLMNESAGFEPIIYRSKYIALESSPNRVVVDPMQLSQFDALHDGFLDGADVFVYRIENGKFVLVREGKVKGFHVSGWLPVGRGGFIPAGPSPRYQFRWDSWNRPGAKYYFAVKAVDRGGAMSAPSAGVEVESPQTMPRPGFFAQPPDMRPPPFPPGGPPGAPPAAPQNLRVRSSADGGVQIDWDPVAGAAAYMVVHSDYPPERQAGFFLELAEPPASAREQIRARDMVFVSKKFYSVPRALLSNRVWGAEREQRMFSPGLVHFFPDDDPRKSWSLVPHEAGSPVEEPGETCLKLTLASGASEWLGLTNHGGTDQAWYEVLEPRPYRVEVWLRQEGSGSVRFRFTGFYEQKIEPISFNVGSQWKKYVATFTPPAVQPGRAPGQMRLEFSGPATFYVDNFRVYRADAEYLDYLPEQYEQLKASGVSVLRTHGIIKTGVRTYDITQLTNNGGVASHIGGWESGAARLNTLPQLLKIMRKAHVDPWLQVEFHLQPQEWLALVEYLAAPYDPAVDSPRSKPWAYKRFAQGQHAPWVQEFDRIYLEFANETWNGLFQPWTFDDMIDAVSGRRYTRGEVYGLFQEHLISVLRGSPYWRASHLDEKVRFVLGGWIGQSYGRDAAAMSPSSRLLTIAAYNGGWDAGEGPPKLDAPSLFNVLAQVNQVAMPMADALARQIAELREGSRSGLRPGTYEAGPGYALNGLNNERVTDEQSREQELAMKSLAAGTATLDSFLTQAYHGFALQNFFTFDSGLQWKSHARWYQGGQAFPSWKAVTLFNTQGRGDMLRTETLSAPSIDLPAFKRRMAAQNAPLAAVYATRRGDRLNLFVVSRKVPQYPLRGDDGFTPVTVELPFRQARSLTLFRMAGDPAANNVERDQVKVEEVRLSPPQGGRFVVNAASGADDRGLPPAATFLYVFDGIAN